MNILLKLFIGYYIYYMKKNKLDRRLTICVPEELFEKFQQVCDANYKSMSEAIRDYMQSYVWDYKRRLMEKINV
jgi:metal-responsive CopG/Arc/MetJ family transcriptional regulator